MANETFLYDSGVKYTNAGSGPGQGDPSNGIPPILEVILGGNDTFYQSGPSAAANRTNGSGPGMPVVPVGPLEIVGISCFFCIIGLVGIVGNLLVIFIILTDRKMRRSVTNLFIMNLAISDLLIMLFGIPEIAQFMLNKGWLLGEAMCKTERYVLVFSLYSSVITLVAVCVERYIAIVHPIKAHIFCSRKRMLVVITLIWPTVLLFGLPVALYNSLIPPSGGPIQFCSLHFPGNNIRFLMIFKYLEFILFYFIPIMIQVVCYIVIGRHLFAGSELLHRKRVVINQDGCHRERTSDAMKARKGVIKMLIASVIIYVISYSPHQVLLFYNTFSQAPFHQTWVYLVFVTAMGYVNSAANPLLYCIFSQNFRRKFKTFFLCKCHMTDRDTRIHLHFTSTDSAGASHTKYTRVPLRIAESNAL